MPHKLLIIGMVIVALAGCGGSGSLPPPPATPMLVTTATPVLRGASTIFVSDRYGRSITEFAATADGNVAPTAAIAGPGTRLTTPGFIAVATNGDIFVTDFGPNSRAFVYRFSAGSNGNASPALSIQLNSAVYYAGVAIDPGKTVDVLNYGGGVESYAQASSNALLRRIDGAATTLTHGYGLAVDPIGALYAVNVFPDEVAVFAAGSDGNSAPARLIAGSATGLHYPYGIALDTQGNVYVTNQGTSTITVYASGSTGNVSPVRTISGPLTNLSTRGEIAGVAVDPAGYIYVGTSVAAGTGQAATSSVLVFAPGANGNVAPVQVISGSLTGLGYPVGIAVH